MTSNALLLHCVGSRKKQNFCLRVFPAWILASGNMSNIESEKVEGATPLVLRGEDERSGRDGKSSSRPRKRPHGGEFISPRLFLCLVIVWLETFVQTYSILVCQNHESDRSRTLNFLLVIWFLDKTLLRLESIIVRLRVFVSPTLVVFVSVGVSWRDLLVC